MIFPFRPVPAASGGSIIPRPVVDIALEGIPMAPLECLVDSGALRTRMGADMAELAGIELDGALTERFYVGGLQTEGRLAQVRLVLGEGDDEFGWDAPVWFCDPWPRPFGLAGIEGFLHHVVVTIHAYDGYLDVEQYGADE